MPTSQRILSQCRIFVKMNGGGRKIEKPIVYVDTYVDNIRKRRRRQERERESDSFSKAAPETYVQRKRDFWSTICRIACSSRSLIRIKVRARRAELRATCFRPSLREDFTVRFRTYASLSVTSSS